MTDTVPNAGRRRKDGDAARAHGLLAGMRIRKKLVFLHTVFWLALAALLVLALRPAVARMLRDTDAEAAGFILQIAYDGIESPESVELKDAILRRVERASHGEVQRVRVWVGSADDLGLDGPFEAQARAEAGRVTGVAIGPEGPMAVLHDPASDRFVGASVRLSGARTAAARLYLILAAALLVAYAFVAIALELFVLPQHVYGPIRSILRADEAVKAGRRAEELIRENAMPADEIGEIMRSRNDAILSIRRHERDLGAALSELEEIATDLRRKNHLIETARRNLAETDRLASLGMMSAGLAHEMNTPLAVLKGLAERWNDPETELSDEDAALMLRVVGRLERLSESLLDFARVRSPRLTPAIIRDVIEEAWTLVRLDRDRSATCINNVADDLVIACDADRMVQVFVNVIRNSIDAQEEAGTAERSVRIDGETSERDGQLWVSITITDTGPGIDPELLSTLFDPFVSTRLDSRGTGLGLAVAEGIVKEHAGVILARNRQDRTGAVFEIMLPKEPSAAHVEGAPTDIDSVRSTGE